MLRNELISAVFLCPGLKNRVCGEIHRLGSFGRIHLFADVLFHKKDQKRDGEIKAVPPSAFGVRCGGDNATPYPVGTKAPGLQRYFGPLLVLFLKVHLQTQMERDLDL